MWPKEERDHSFREVLHGRHEFVSHEGKRNTALAQTLLCFSSASTVTKQCHQS